MNLKYFVNDCGVIYTVFEDGSSNFPGDILVHCERQDVETLGAEDGYPQSREITGTYTLHASLTVLASVIEG